MVLFGPPNHAVTGKVRSEPLERLPCEIHLAVAGPIEVGPEEWSLVFCDLGRGHQPFCDLVQIDARLVGVVVGGYKMSMAQLCVCER